MYSVGFGFNDDTATHGIPHMIEKLNGALYTPDSMIPGNKNIYFYNNIFLSILKKY